ncbi:hypothetical protein QAD02_006408 [Eretmocerus hayati]|uniref:Uncharacterized protein n=1 Tax=Eretmocerus hayati TaxID=131215 RepID=A0ACC2N147_9HYME|nr:hypothetical protein QAD02_006408 [Eretmocerus hayati]
MNFMYYLFCPTIFQVIPADRRAIADKDNQETWASESEQPTDHNQTKIPHEKFQDPASDDNNQTSQLTSRNHETRRSKSKKVKSYLKRCKGALGRSDSTDQSQKKAEKSSCSAWYVDDGELETESKEAFVSNETQNQKTLGTQEVEIGGDEDVRHEGLFEFCKVQGSEGGVILGDDGKGQNSGQVLGDGVEEEDKCDEDVGLSECGSSDTLIAESKEDCEDDAAHDGAGILPDVEVSFSSFSKTLAFSLFMIKFC